MAKESLAAPPYRKNNKHQGGVRGLSEVFELDQPALVDRWGTGLCASGSCCRFEDSAVTTQLALHHAMLCHRDTLLSWSTFFHSGPLNQQQIHQQLSSVHFLTEERPLSLVSTLWFLPGG